MANFLTALNAGLDAAGVAEKNRREVSEVFAELNNQLREGTQGKVEISRIEISNPFDAFNVVSGRNRVPPKGYLEVRSMVRSGERKTIAGWKQDRYGCA